MLKNYFKIAIRNLLKNKTNSSINIFGLAVGMAIFLLITMYCLNEFSYNKIYQNHRSIYQVEIGNSFNTPIPLGSLVKNNIPGLENIVRIDYGMGGGKSSVIETYYNGVTKKNDIKDVVFADSTLLTIFKLPVICGNPDKALNKPFSLILTRTTALSLFGTVNVVGQTIHYTGDNGLPMDMTITAVIEDFPKNSTLSFNAAGSLSSFYTIGKKIGYNLNEDWRNFQYDTFILINNSNVNTYADRINELWKKQEKVLDKIHTQINLIALDDVYFHNNSKWLLTFILQLIGIFILLLAIINFINLTITNSVSRTKEIGIRKVIGANRSALLKQFLGESIFISLLSMTAALMIVEVIKPWFVTITDKPIQLGLLYQPLTILILIVGIILIGFISGIYPAILISAFKPVSILKNEISKGKKGNSLRYILIVFQFVISISLIICTIIISKQMNYLKTKDLGLNTKNIIHFKQKYQINQHYNAFKQQLLENPDIIHVSRSNLTFGGDLPIEAASMFHGLKKSYSATTVDPDFIPAMGIQMLQGRQFSWDIRSDINKTAVVNETFVREFELTQPLGTIIDFINWKVTIIGVMKDFNYTSLHQKIEPAAILYADWNGEINIQISNHNISKTIQYIKNTWYKFSPDNPFAYEFLNETYDKHYKSDEQFQSIINSFSVIAIFIACLGLLGLVSINIDRRIKEIGIRKILGASVNSIVYTLTGELFRWIVLSNIIAWPVAYYCMNKWLQNYAYRTEISWWIFVISGGIAIAIALATVSFQVVKAAVSNPVESLKHE